MNKKLKFIEKAINVHDDKYEYSLVEYEDSQKNIKIICPKHGVFEQRPANHIRGQGCSFCSGVGRLNTKTFILKANEIHNNKFDYSEVEYINNKTKIKIICPEHGVFETRPDNHINKKSGCPVCANNQLYSKDDFIKKANKIHKNKYDYSEVEYIDAHTKIKIICTDHGVFIQKPYSHLTGVGCPICKNDRASERMHYLWHNNHFQHNKSFSKDEFIKKANNKHDNKYDYSLVDYKRGVDKVKIICPEHGVFIQEGSSHLSGTGCPTCNNERKKYDTEKNYRIIKRKT